MSAAALPYSVEVDRRADATTVVTLAGEFDVAAIPLLRSSLAGINFDDFVTIDLEQVTFCDAATVGILVDERRRRSHRLSVGPTSAAVQRLANILDMPWLTGQPTG